MSIVTFGWALAVTPKAMTINPTTNNTANFLISFPPQNSFLRFKLASDTTKKQ
jgi:hypothetical protein